MSEEFINHYKADERETQFLLFEQFAIQDLFESEKYGDFSEDDARMILSEALKFVTNEVGPMNSYFDRLGCTLDPETGNVATPPLMKELQRKYVENGWHLTRVSPEYGGQGLPYSVGLAVEEFFMGASAAWTIYGGLSTSAAHLIETFGTEEQKATYVEKIYSGEWMGTMCLTEPGAGSDVGSSKSKARKNDDGTYSIEATKCFISGGNHDLTEQIVHLLLARIEGDAPGTKGLSLFIIPKFRVNPDGSLGESNDVVCRGVEKKMGIHGSATCTMNFGDNGGCVGTLLGGVQSKGITQMFQMMNEARIGTGMQALATASSAYLNAVSYARERKQGKPFEAIATGQRGTQSVSIIEHEDIRRMLLEMKAKVEGMRALTFKLAVHMDRAQVAGEGEEASRHMGYVELLTPLVKAYLSDQGFRVAELAIQTYGGYGYISDYPVEQYCRDIKIQSLVEGTNYIQALDLVGRKLNLRGGALVRQLGKDIHEFCAAHAGHPSLATEMKRLDEALEALNKTIMGYAGFFSSGRLRQIPLTATRLLEMLAEVTVGHLLLEGAVIANEKMQGLGEKDREFAFYAAKVHTARFFIRNILPGVKMKAEIIADGDTSAIDMQPDQFPMVGAD